MIRRRSGGALSNVPDPEASSEADGATMSHPLLRASAWGPLLAFAFAFVWVERPEWTALLAAIGLVMTVGPMLRGWRASDGLTLRPTVAWGFIAVALGLIAQCVALTEPMASGRAIAGHWAYLSSLATIAALISTLGARSPGQGAWAILMGLLVLVFLIPWLEGLGIRSGTSALGRLRLDAPWSIFYGLLVLAGVTNYLFTRHAGSSALIGAALIVELAGLCATTWPPSRRAVFWSLAPFLGAWGVLRADAEARSESAAAPGLPSLWLWFRDRWGVVWALRVRERFHRAAEAAGWPVRLTWTGAAGTDGGLVGSIPPEAALTLASLLRRFATAQRLEEVAATVAPGSCPEQESARE